MVEVDLNYLFLVPEKTYQEHMTSRVGKRTINQTVEFIRDNGGLSGRVLDIGQRTGMTSYLEEVFEVRIENTDLSDLNWSFISVEQLGRYDFVLCFHVLEHLCNPLLCLMEIKSALSVSGILFLSTPLMRKVDVLGPVNRYHFQEFNRKQLSQLFQIVGLSFFIEEVRLFYSYIGLRPILKGFSRKNMLAMAWRR